MIEHLLAVKGLCKYFEIRSGFIRRRNAGIVKAVDDVTFTVDEGKVFALIGESGSGKTTLCQTVLRIYEPTSGEIWFDNTNISQLKGKALKEQRKKIGIVFQDPKSSLNPMRSVKDTIGDPMRFHNLCSRSKRVDRVMELLDLVGLPKDYTSKYPGGLSGGEMQRVGIGRALALNPKLIILDEPTSSLDVSVQAKILRLLKDLQARLNLAYLLSTHDLSVVRNLSDEIGVMYLGRFMETCSNEELFRNPLHPYTVALLSSIPVLSEEELETISRESKELGGSMPNPLNAPSGCRLFTRCPEMVEGLCDKKEPRMFRVGEGHYVRCHKFSEP